MSQHKFEFADPNIKVVNIKWGTKDYPEGLAVVYCGRNYGKYKDIGLGNPYKVGVDGSLEQVLKNYKFFLDLSLGVRPVLPTGGAFRMVYAIMAAHGGAVLQCWCKPAPCHCDILKDKLLEIWRLNNPNQWDCRFEGKCIYDALDDPARDECVKCGQPFERK